jgi:hypothetical protein
MLGDLTYGGANLPSRRKLLIAAMMVWGGLTGFISAQLLVPYTAPRRPTLADSATSSFLAAAPREPVMSPRPFYGGQGVRVGLPVEQHPQPSASVPSQSICRGADPSVLATCGVSTDRSPDERLVAATRSSEAQMPSVLIFHRAGSASGREAAQRLAGEARRAGLEVAGVAAAQSVPTKREVRYLKGGYAADGERLASRFRERWGNSWQVRELGSGVISPAYSTTTPLPAHTLEVWLPHR